MKNKEPMGGSKGQKVEVGSRRKYDVHGRDDIAQQVAKMPEVKLPKSGVREGDDQAYVGGKHQGVCYTHHNQSKTGYDD